MDIFYKLHGAGNDFIFFLGVDSQPERVKALCDRNTGIGADGVAWLTHHGEHKYTWKFYNSDGSSAEMCGNAARCAMRLVQTVHQQTEMELQTLAGLIKGGLEGPDISVSFNIDTAAVREIVNPAGRDFPKGYFLTTGVPHCVIPTAQPHNLHSRASELRQFLKNPEFGAQGANLTFADFQSHPVKTVTLERGVENFTKACGTGVIATAKVYQYIYNKANTLQLQSPGGTFKVSFNEATAKLTGPAELVFKGEI